MDEAKKADQKERFINPITGEEVDEIIKESEAKLRGYLDFQFMLRYLEDENEFVKYFIVNGKKIIVDIQKPTLQYKKPVSIDHERVLRTEPRENTVPSIGTIGVVATTCNIDDQSSCLSCSG